MKLKHALTALFMTFSLSVPVAAVAQGYKNEKHNIGVKAGGGGADYLGKDTDGQGVGELYVYYNYEFLSQVYVEVGVLGGGDIDSWECLEEQNNQWQCAIDGDEDDEFSLQADKLTYNGLVAALKTDLKLTQRNSLYAKAGAVFYDYELELNSDVVADKDGTGFIIEAGWQYRWDNGMGLNFSFHRQDMGDLEVVGSTFGVSYSF